MSLFSKNSIHDTWTLSKRPLALWLLTTIVALSSKSGGWHTFFVTCGTFHDAGNYSQIAKLGYQNHLEIFVFYPLWPLLIRMFSFGTQNDVAIGLVGSFLATILFLMSIHCFVYWLRQNNIKKFIHLGVALLILSPLSVFRVLSFTESLYSFLLMIFFMELTAERKTITRLLLVTMLLTLTRPLFPILMATSLFGALFNLYLFQTKQIEVAPLNLNLKKFAGIFIFAPIGYLPFGLLALTRTGNFWQPFESQKYWNRSFGLHWDVLTSPKAINGSNEVLTWELLAFYGSFAIALWFLRLLIKSRKSVDISTSENLNLNVQTVILVAALISCAHSMIAFLSHDRFMSLARHVLTNPIMYLSLICLLNSTNPKNHPLFKKILIGILVISVIFLGMWWYRFTKDQWIG